jgi:uncharacterized protein
MYTGTLSFDLLLGDVHSLKEKRSVVRPIIAELRRAHAVSVAEVGDQDLHRRARIGLAVVSGELTHVTDVLDRCERWMAGRPEVDLLSARRRLHGDDD